MVGGDTRSHLQRQVKRSPGRGTERDGPPRCGVGGCLKEGKATSCQSVGISVQITLSRVD